MSPQPLSSIASGAGIHQRLQSAFAGWLLVTFTQKAIINQDLNLELVKGLIAYAVQNKLQHFSLLIWRLANSQIGILVSTFLAFVMFLSAKQPVFLSCFKGGAGNCAAPEQGLLEQQPAEYCLCLR